MQANLAAGDLSRQEHKTWQFSPSGALGGPLSAGSAGAWTPVSQ